jgi:hypothetical protein
MQSSRNEDNTARFLNCLMNADPKTGPRMPQIQQLEVTCPRFSGPIFAGKFQFSGMCDSGRRTRKDDEENQVFGGADCLHPAAR